MRAAARTVFKVTCKTLRGAEVDIHGPKREIFSANTDMGIGEHDGKLIMIKSETENSSKSQYLRITITGRERAYPATMSFYGTGNSQNGPIDTTQNNRFNDTGVIATETHLNDNNLYYTVTGKLTAPLQRLADFASWALNTDEASNLSLIKAGWVKNLYKSESLTVQKDGSLLYSYTAIRRTAFMSSQEVDEKVAFPMRKHVKEQISQLEVEHPDVDAAGECRLEPVGNK
ncbi:MAG: hypothetical protein WCW52_08370 [Elusimicrobiales bacterium]